VKDFHIPNFKSIAETSLANT